MIYIYRTAEIAAINGLYHLPQAWQADLYVYKNHVHIYQYMRAYIYIYTYIHIFIYM